MTEPVTGPAGSGKTRALAELRRANEPAYQAAAAEIARQDVEARKELGLPQLAVSEDACLDPRDLEAGQ